MVIDDDLYVELIIQYNTRNVDDGRIGGTIISRRCTLYEVDYYIVHTLLLLDMYYIPIRIYYRINNMEYYNFCRRQLYNIILLLNSHTELFKLCLVECISNNNISYSFKIWTIRMTYYAWPFKCIIMISSEVYGCYGLLLYTIKSGLPWSWSAKEIRKYSRHP